MVTIPAWQYAGLVLCLIACIAGWGYTISQSMKRAAKAYELGDRHGYTRGCQTMVKKLKPLIPQITPAKKKRGRR